MTKSGNDENRQEADVWADGVGGRGHAEGKPAVYRPSSVPPLVTPAVNLSTLSGV
jgi:hypothetical protein